MIGVMRQKEEMSFYLPGSLFSLIMTKYIKFFPEKWPNSVQNSEFCWICRCFIRNQTGKTCLQPISLLFVDPRFIKHDTDTRLGFAPDKTITS